MLVFKIYLKLLGTNANFAKLVQVKISINIQADARKTKANSMEIPSWNPVPSIAITVKKMCLKPIIINMLLIALKYPKKLKLNYH